MVNVFCAAAAAKLLQLCLTLRDLIDGNPPGSPVPGILQARTLEWVAISLLALNKKLNCLYHQILAQILRQMGLGEIL